MTALLQLKTRRCVLLVLSLSLLCCSGDSPAPSDSALPDVAHLDAAPDLPQADALLADGGPATDGGGPRDLAALVRTVIGPHVDSAKPAKLETTVGAIVAVVHGNQGQVVGLGATRAGGAVAPNAQTLFQVGSVTKVLTGLILAAQVHGKQLAPGALVNDHLPAVLGTPAATAATTLRQLVSHTSGLPIFPANMTDRDGDGKKDPGIDPLSPAEGYTLAHLGSYLKDPALSLTPGTYHYSNPGIGLLAVALQHRLAAADYHALLTAKLTQPLGMGCTYGTWASVPVARRARLAQGYAPKDTTRVVGRPSTMGVMAGAGEVLTCGQDLLTLLRALVARPTSALEPAIQQALTPLAAINGSKQIGYAIDVAQRDGTTVYMKSGNTSSYSAFVAFRRAPAAGVALVVNVGSFTKTRTLALDLLDAL